MESHGEPTLRPSPDEARAFLDDVRQVEADLADRLVTPWWYHPGLGLVEALFVSSMTFPVWLGLPALAVGVAGLGLLVRNWQRLTGLGAISRQYNVLAREWVIALLVVLAVAMAVVLLVDAPAVTAVTAVVVFVATVVIGRRGDSVIRHRLRHGTRTR